METASKIWTWTAHCYYHNAEAISNPVTPVLFVNSTNKIRTSFSSQNVSWNTQQLKHSFSDLSSELIEMQFISQQVLYVWTIRVTCTAHVHCLEHHTRLWMKKNPKNSESYHVSNHRHGEDKYGSHGPYVSCPARAINPHRELHQPFGKPLGQTNKQWLKQTLSLLLNWINQSSELQCRAAALHKPVYLFSPLGRWQPGRTPRESAARPPRPRESHS